MKTDDCCNEKGHCRCNVWKCIGWSILGVLGFAAFAALVGWAIMALWNCLLPDIFGLPVIGYWQAVGLAILSRLLFGGCGRGFRHMYRKHRGHGCKCGCCCGSGCNCGCKDESGKECCSDKDSGKECCKKEHEHNA